MEAAEDVSFLQAMKKARIMGALVGVEAVTPEGLKDIYKDFNFAGEELVTRLKKFRENGVYVLGSFIFGLPSDRPSTFDATVDLAERADISFAQFVTLTPFPGTLDFERWEREEGDNIPKIDGVSVSRHWLIPQAKRPKLFSPHPVMSAEEIRQRTQQVWDRFYSVQVDLAPVHGGQVAAVPPGVSAALEAVQTDVRQHRSVHRQRARLALDEVGPADGQTGSAAVRGRADARPAGPCRTATRRGANRSRVAAFAIRSLSTARAVGCRLRRSPISLSKEAPCASGPSDWLPCSRCCRFQSAHKTRTTVSRSTSIWNTSRYRTRGCHPTASR